MNGLDLRGALERAHRTIADRPLHRQPEGKTWTRQELIESGDRLELEGYDRKKAALAMVPNRPYSNEEVAFLVREVSAP